MLSPEGRFLQFGPPAHVQVAPQAVAAIGREIAAAQPVQAAKAEAPPSAVPATSARPAAPAAPAPRPTPPEVTPRNTGPFRIDRPATRVNGQTTPVPKIGDVDSVQVLGTATYVAGTTNLEPGRRYGIAVQSSRLLIMGPMDADPTRVALDRPLTGTEARSVDGRLILANQQGWVVAFMALAGPPAQQLAAILHAAASVDT